MRTRIPPEFFASAAGSEALDAAKRSLAHQGIEDDAVAEAVTVNVLVGFMAGANADPAGMTILRGIIEDYERAMSGGTQ